jgi:hypothetical protein
LSLVDLVFVEIQVLDALDRDGGQPVDTCHIVVVDQCLVCGVNDGDVFCSIYDGEELLYAFVSSDDFGLG